MNRNRFRLVLAALGLMGLLGCATLPDTSELIERHAGQTARFENARGPLSVQRNAAVLAKLKQKSGDIDILEKQIALEQSVIDSPLVLGNKITLLQDGAQTYAAMFAAIAQATDHINLESYIIEDDAVGQQFADVLLKSASRGVQVNLIYDSVGCLGTPASYFKRLREGGIDVLEFNPVNPLNATTPWLLNNRDHRKILVVDGRIAFIGGINISDVYASGSLVLSGARKAGPTRPGAVAWRDTDLQIEGPVVADLQKLFMATWLKQGGAALVGKDYLPDLKAQGSDIVRAIGSSYDDSFSLMYLTLISAIGNAERQVYLTHAYFVPDVQLLKALTDAASRGVDVRLILPSQSDSALVFNAGRAHYSSLLEAGVKLYERRDALLHAKTAVIDGVWSTVGSTNLDWRSFLDNDEVNVVILGREFALKMQSMFAQDLQASQEIELQSWNKRPLLERMREWWASLLRRLL